MQRSSAQRWSFLLAFLLLFTPSLELWAAKKKNTRKRRAAPRYTAPSYGDPTAEDSLAGDDPVVREIAVRALGNYNGSVVVSEAETGRVLAIVNQKQALSSGFKPCSTIKLAVGLAALEEGLITGDTLIKVSRRKKLNLTDALAHSDNPFFEILGRKMGFETVSSYARLLGIGELAGYLIEDEFPGSFPTAPPPMAAWGGCQLRGRNQGDAAPTGGADGGVCQRRHALLSAVPAQREDRAEFEPRVKRRLPIQALAAATARRHGSRGAVRHRARGSYSVA
jgi:membrane peptidoglycan carboxypeptidase